MSCFMLFFFHLSSRHLSLPLKSNPFLQTQPLKLLQLTSGFLKIFGSTIQDCFQTFFQNNNFFFQTQSYQTGDQNRPLKTQEQNSFRYPIFFYTFSLYLHSVCMALTQNKLMLLKSS